MKKPRTVSGKPRVITRLILWYILPGVWLAALLFCLGSFDSVFAEDKPPPPDPPPVPPIEEHVRWDIGQVPANLTVVWANGLQMAFPVISSTHFHYEETFKDQGGLWYFRAPCTSYQRIVRPTAILYRWGEDQEWLPYIRKTSGG